MNMTFRWFGERDPIPLEYIGQIPGVRGVVSALYDTPVGESWSRDAVEALAESIDTAGLQFSVVESIPIHEDIKLGRPTRDRLIENYTESVRRVGEINVPVVCYNFMPVFDWTRTDLAMLLPDGSTALAYDDDELSRISLANGTSDLPGWAAAYDGPALGELLNAYATVDAEQLWENLAYFLDRVVPVAAEVGVRMGIHPDDPPWQIFGLPRIIVDGAALERVVGLVDSPANGVTFCTGSLGANPLNDLPDIARRLGNAGRISFVHARNVKVTGTHKFHEVPHSREYGDVDLREVLRALRETSFDGPMRPDHGRMIWGERGRPGYGLYDRALGATYLQGLWDGLEAHV